MSTSACAGKYGDAAGALLALDAQHLEGNTELEALRALHGRRQAALQAAMLEAVQQRVHVEDCMVRCCMAH